MNITSGVFKFLNGLVLRTAFNTIYFNSIFRCSQK